MSDISQTLAANNLNESINKLRTKLLKLLAHLGNILCLWSVHLSERLLEQYLLDVWLRHHNLVGRLCLYAGLYGGYG